ncbi:MAG: ABC transporter permease [Ilumatobacteraceae bacterium]|nr:ABC transporter permease [Ilumatobacteraceae bacterium]
MSVTDNSLSVVRPLWAVVIRSFAFLRKEVVEIIRQPRLVALLVVGPFALLVLFGSGYSETAIVKRAIFVGPEGSIYEEVLDTYEADLSDFIESQGMVATEAEGVAELDAGRADLVVIFPDDPATEVMAGERAVIRLIHNEIDPIQEGAVEISARLAIQEVNATVLTTLAVEAQDSMPDSATMRDRLLALSNELAEDPIATRDLLVTELDLVEDALSGSATVLDRLDLGDDQRGEALAAARTDTLEITDELQTISEETTDEELTELADAVATLTASLDEVVILDPEILIRPFQSRTDNRLDGRINPTEYFTPASLALLLQHLALTFAALSLVRDRRTGLFELMRVGPLSSVEIIIGKIFAYLLVGTAVGALLMAASVYGLSVPLAGSVGWVAFTVVGVLLASLALGMVLAIVAGTESQAVQYAMLVLLAGLFFSGFILPIDGLAAPVSVISWMLPVTYGIASFQDVMLRGLPPDNSVIIGLSALVVGYGAIAILGLRRQLSAKAAA